jgi:hypothetical protein
MHQRQLLGCTRHSCNLAAARLHKKER